MGARLHEDAPERGGGPDIGEYQGLPINEAARFHADTWSSSLWTVPEHQASRIRRLRSELFRCPHLEGR